MDATEKAIKTPDPLILARFSKAVSEMLADDDLVRARPQEFSITPDLAFKMQPHFSEWRVSAEWSSREDKYKKIRWQDDEGKLQTKRIRPDIIVHIPHTEINILAVEAKKASSRQKYDDDIKKLSLMTLYESADPDCHYGYRLGVHLIVDLPKRAITGNNVYRNGEVDPELTELLRKLVN